MSNGLNKPYLPPPWSRRFSWAGEPGARLRRAVGTYAGVLVVLVVIVGIFSSREHQFHTFGNVQNIIQSNASLMIVSVGVTLTLLVGGFDLSVGGVLVLSSVILAKLLAAGVSTGLAIVIVVVGAVIFGIVFNGFIVAWLGVNFFVVTLGASTLTYGLALSMTNGNTVLIKNNFILKLGNGSLWSIPFPGVIAFVVVIFGIVLTRYSGFGRMVYVVGGNMEAARLAGINVVAVRVATYGISAGLAAVGGVIEAGRLSSASPTSNSGLELTVAAAVLIGGTSFAGGIGTMLGTVLGVAFLGTLQDGLLIGSVSAYYQGVVTGLVLVASVVVDRLRQIRAERLDARRQHTAQPVTVATESGLPVGHRVDASP